MGGRAGMEAGGVEGEGREGGVSCKAVGQGALACAVRMQVRLAAAAAGSQQGRMLLQPNPLLGLT